MGVKTACPVSRQTFRQKAKAALRVVIDGREFEAEAKEFSTGSLGWFANTKIVVEIDGVRVPVQVGLNLTIIGSKELPK